MRAEDIRLECWPVRVHQIEPTTGDPALRHRTEEPRLQKPRELDARHLVKDDIGSPALPPIRKDMELVLADRNEALGDLLHEPFAAADAAVFLGDDGDPWRNERRLSWHNFA